MLAHATVGGACGRRIIVSHARGGSSQSRKSQSRKSQSRKSQSRKFVVPPPLPAITQVAITQVRGPSTQHTFIVYRLLQGLRRAYQAQRGSRNSRAALLCTRGIPASLSCRSVQGFGLGFRSVSGMSASNLGLRIEGLRFVVYLLFVCCLSVL